jgi:putative membrane protein
LADQVRATASAGTVVPADAGLLSAVDRDFVTAVFQDGFAEVDMARFASRRADSSAVRDIARTTEAQQRKAVEELAAIVARLGVAPPAARETARREGQDALAGLSGRAFDRQYVLQQLAAETVRLASYERQAEQGGNAQLRAFARRHAPDTQRRLDALRLIDSDLAARGR